MPTVPTLISFMKHHHRVQQILDTPNAFNTNKERDQFTNAYFSHDPHDDDDFWTNAINYTIDSIQDNIPQVRGGLKTKRDAYFKDMIHLVNEHFYKRKITIYEGTAWEDNAKLSNLSGRLGYVFIDCVEQLITPPKGSKIVLISQQLNSCLAELEDKPLEDYFSPEVNQHVYYIAGFLCRAGEKESKRRSTNHNVGACIAAISSHFCSTASDITIIKEDLPNGITELVDQKSVYGGLKYPDRQFFLWFQR